MLIYIYMYMYKYNFWCVHTHRHIHNTNTHTHEICIPTCMHANVFVRTFVCMYTSVRLIRWAFICAAIEVRRIYTETVSSVFTCKFTSYVVTFWLHFF